MFSSWIFCLFRGRWVIYCVLNRCAWLFSFKRFLFGRSIYSFDWRCFVAATLSIVCEMCFDPTPSYRWVNRLWCYFRIFIDILVRYRNNIDEIVDVFLPNRNDDECPLTPSDDNLTAVRRCWTCLNMLMRCRLLQIWFAVSHNEESVRKSSEAEKDVHLGRWWRRCWCWQLEWHNECPINHVHIVVGHVPNEHIRDQY